VEIITRIAIWHIVRSAAGSWSTAPASTLRLKKTNSNEFLQHRLGNEFPQEMN
jgi:hypothetical protein